ncbi:hypothetical protein [Rhizobium sp.]
MPSETEITYRVLEELEAFQGVYWKEVQGQFHGAYDEAAIWILLSDAAELPRAHRRFRDVVASRFYLVRFTVFYTVMTPEGELILDCLNDNDEIERAGTSRPLGAHPLPKRSVGSVFNVAEKPRRHVH